MLSNKAHLGEWKTRSIHNAHIQFSSIAQSCLTLFDSMNRSMPGFPVHHQHPEFTQTHVHLVGDAIQAAISCSVVPFSSCSQSLPASESFPMSQLRIRWSKYWSFSFSIIPSKEHPGLIFRMDWLDLLAVQGTLKNLLQTTVQKHQFFSAQLFSQSNSHIHTWPLEKS